MNFAIIPILASAFFNSYIVGFDKWPEFTEYKASSYYHEKPAKIDFKTWPESKEYKTTISDTQNKGANFAGHFVISEWGCGTFCRGISVSDAKNGRISFYAETLYEAPEGLSFNIDSNLLILNPLRDDEKSTSMEQLYEERIRGVNGKRSLPHFWKWNESDKRFEDIGLITELKN